MPILKRKLSSRLQFIFSQLLTGQAVWDLCCDHGYLGIKAHSSGLFNHIHFVDQMPHLIAPLRERFSGVEGASFYSIPAQEIEIPLDGNVAAAGVGAELICKILSAQMQSKNLQARRLVLGPHKDSEKLQDWLSQNLVFSKLYCLNKIHQIEERGRPRAIFVYDQRQ